MSALSKRLEQLEQALNRTQDPDNPRITVIEIRGDRGNGEETLETWRLEAGKWRKDDPR